MKKVYNVKYYKCDSCDKFIESKSDGCRCYECDGIVKEYDIEIIDNWTNKLYVGNVVKWSDEFWIVYEVNATVVRLISFTTTNCSSHPSVYWPYDPSKRIQSIEFVANNIKDYLLQSLSSIFKGINFKKMY